MYNMSLSHVSPNRWLLWVASLLSHGWQIKGNIWINRRIIIRNADASPAGHKGSLNSLTSMKKMWIICFTVTEAKPYWTPMGDSDIYLCIISRCRICQPDQNFRDFRKICWTGQWGWFLLLLSQHLVDLWSTKSFRFVLYKKMLQTNHSKQGAWMIQ